MPHRQFQGKASILKTTVCSCSHCTNSVVKKTEYFEDESVASTSSHSPFSSEDRFRLNCIETKGRKNQKDNENNHEKFDSSIHLELIFSKVC